LHNDTNVFEIKSKCTAVNWQKSPTFTFNTERMSDKTTVDAVAYAENFNGDFNFF